MEILKEEIRANLLSPDGRIYTSRFQTNKGLVSAICAARPAATVAASIFLILHDLDKQPVCPICGKVLGLRSLNSGFTQYCSNKCRYSDPAYNKKMSESAYNRDNASLVEKRKATYIERYGVDNPMRSEEIKKKAVQTCIERYGVEYSTQSPEVRQRVIQTNLERYGVESPHQTAEVKERRKRTLIERYGVDNPSKIDGYRDRFMATMNERDAWGRRLARFERTCMERYGVPNPSMTNKVKDKVRETMLNRFSNDAYPHYEESTPHKIIKSYLEDVLSLEVKSNDRLILFPKEVDLYIETAKVGIEVNGDYWHSAPKEKDAKLRKIHAWKVDAMNSIGQELLQIRDGDIRRNWGALTSFISQYLGFCETIPLDHCSTKYVTEMGAAYFYREYWFRDAEGDEFLGIFSGQELLGVIASSNGVYRPPVFKMGFVVDKWWELLRHGAVIRADRDLYRSDIIPRKYETGGQGFIWIDSRKNTVSCESEEEAWELGLRRLWDSGYRLYRL